MLHSWRTAPGLSGWKDILLNIAIYVPVGLFAALKLRRRSLLTRIAVPLVLGASVSLTVEVMQVYDVSRFPSGLDWATNVLGTLVGIAAALLLPHVFLGPLGWLGARMRRSPSAALLCGMWLAYWTFPWMPYLSPTGWLGKLRYFVTAPWPFVTLLSSAAACLATGMLLRTISRTHVVMATAMAVLVIPAQIALLGRHPALVELTGALLGFVLFLALHNHSRGTRIAAAVVCATLVIRGLSPFALTMSPKPFEWVPLLASLSADRTRAVFMLLEKCAWYGTAIWLLWHSGLRLLPSALSVATGLAAIEAAQRWLPGRTPEASDPLIALAMATVFIIAERKSRLTAAPAQR